MGNVTNLRKVSTVAMVDQLGDLRARIKHWKDEAKDIENALIKRGLPVLEGRLFVATIIESERTITDWQKIAKDLGASKQKISANSRKFDVTAIKVTAHKK